MHMWCCTSCSASQHCRQKLKSEIIRCGAARGLERSHPILPIHDVELMVIRTGGRCGSWVVRLFFFLDLHALRNFSVSRLLRSRHHDCQTHCTRSQSAAIGRQSTVACALLKHGSGQAGQPGSRVAPERRGIIVVRSAHLFSASIVTHRQEESVCSLRVCNGLPVHKTANSVAF